MDEREIYAINLTKHMKTGGIEKKVNKKCEEKKKRRNNMSIGQLTIQGGAK
jgi:hypothetical protein